MDMLDNRTMQLSLEIMRMDNLSGGRLLLANDVQAISPPNGTYWPSSNPNMNHANVRAISWSGAFNISTNGNPQQIYRPSTPQVPPPSPSSSYTNLPQPQNGSLAYLSTMGYPMCQPPSLPTRALRAGQSPPSQARLGNGGLLQGNLSVSRVGFSNPPSPSPASTRHYSNLSAPPSVAPFCPPSTTAAAFNPYSNVNIDIPPMANTTLSTLRDLESQLSGLKHSPSLAPLPCIPESPASPLEGKADSTVAPLEDCGAMTILPVFNDSEKSPKSVKTPGNNDESSKAPSIPPATPVSIMLSPPSHANMSRCYPHSSPEKIVNDIVDSLMSGDLSTLDSSICSSPSMTPPAVVHPTQILNGLRSKRITNGNTDNRIAHSMTRQSGKSIAALKAQQSHRSRHIGPPYPCWYPNCNQSFARRNNIERHISDVHLRRTPYKCTWPGCKKAFSQKGNLNAHQRTHTGERPFVCSFPDCNMSFTAKSNLRTHERKHSGERPHVCTYPKCGKSFIRTTALRSHSLKAHGVAPSDNGDSSA